MTINQLRSTNTGTRTSSTSARTDIRTGTSRAGADIRAVTCRTGIHSGIRTGSARTHSSTCSWRGVDVGGTRNSRLRDSDIATNVCSRIDRRSWNRSRDVHVTAEIGIRVDRRIISSIRGWRRGQVPLRLRAVELTICTSRAIGAAIVPLVGGTTLDRAATTVTASTTAAAAAIRATSLHCWLSVTVSAAVTAVVVREVLIAATGIVSVAITITASTAAAATMSRLNFTRWAF